MKRLMSAAMLVAAMSSAQATIDFDDLATTAVAAGVNPVNVDGYTFSNVCLVSQDCLVAWDTAGSRTMDPGGAALAIIYGGTTTTLTRADGAAFDLRSIDLADVYNEGTVSDWSFTFTYAAGGSEVVTLSLDNQIGGQTFAFGKTGLSSVSWVVTQGDHLWGQFDNVDVALTSTGVPSAVPEPASIALMLGGLGLVGLRARAATRDRQR